MSNTSKRLRPIIYGVTVVPLLVMLGFYFLQRVPEREEYFLNLRFRTLGVIGKQIETKLESVSSGLTYGRSIEKVGQWAGSQEQPVLRFPEYVHKVFPGLQPAEPVEGPKGKAEASPAVDPEILFSNTDRVRFVINGNEIQWEDSLARLIGPFADDPIFDDVLLADKNGTVLFQRSDSTPKIRDVSALLKGSATARATVLRRLESQGGGYDTDLLREVDLDGSVYQLFALPLTIQVPRAASAKPKDLLLCGLVQTRTLRREAMHVTPKYLLWMVIPLLAALLSGPFLKLVLLRRTGRFSARDLPLLSLFSCLAMALLTLVLLVVHQQDQQRQSLEQGLRDFAARLDKQLEGNFQSGQEFLQSLDAYAAQVDAQSPKPVARNRVRVWSDEALAQQVPAVRQTEFEFVFWTSADGVQIEKWTPFETNTPFYPQTSSLHYQLASTGQYWRDRNHPEEQFAGDLLISPTTSTPIAVMTIPSRRNQELTFDRNRLSIDRSTRSSVTAAFVSLVATPRNLLTPVIPPETGYAIVQPDGAVLYHSNRDRILNENLFRETEDAGDLVAAVNMRTERSMQASYRGNNVLFHVRPIQGIAGIPWTIVVFREIEPLQAFLEQVCLGVVVLYLLLWVAPALALAGALGLAKWRYRCQWNGCRIRAIRYCWPHAGGAAAYHAVIRVEVALAAAFLAVLFWFTRRPDGTAGTFLLMSAFLLPVLAMAAWVWQLRRHKPAAAAPSWRHTYVAALCLGLLLSSVLPVTAFFHLALRFESGLATRRWETELAGRVLQHRSQAVAEVHESANTVPATVTRMLSLVLPPEPSPDCDHERLYEAFQVSVQCVKAGPLPAIEVPLWMQALQGVRPQLPNASDPAALQPGDYPGMVRAGLGEPELWLSPIAGGRRKSSLVVKSGLSSLPLIPRLASWWVLFLALLAASAVWVWNAAARLFLFDFHKIPLRTLQQLPPPRELDHPILVLGLPRAGKDRAVRQYIQQRAIKVDLKEDLNEQWLHDNLARLGIGTAAKTQAAAASEGSLRSGGESRPTRPEWIHVTNLEASLQETGRRDLALRLLDAILRLPDGERPNLVVTSVLDPMLQFDAIFPDQVAQVDRSPLPETEVGRWAHVLLQFERVLAVDSEPKPHWAAKGWGVDLWKECHRHRSLRRLGDTIAEGIAARVDRGEPSPTHDEIVEELQEKALALYKLFWSACTRPEKLMLVQLAQTGLVNPLCQDTLHELMRKGLVTAAPFPMVLNESFARFLRHAALPSQIAAWEKEGGESHWPIIRNVLAILAVFALVMVGISQNQALQTISAILTAVAGAIGGSLKLADVVSQKLRAAPGGSGTN